MRIIVSWGEGITSSYTGGGGGGGGGDTTHGELEHRHGKNRGTKEGAGTGPGIAAGAGGVKTGCEEEIIVVTRGRRHYLII